MNNIVYARAHSRLDFNDDPFTNFGNFGQCVAVLSVTTEKVEVFLEIILYFSEHQTELIDNIAALLFQEPGVYREVIITNSIAPQMSHIYESYS